MRWEWRKDRRGNLYRSFAYYDNKTKKPVRLTKKGVPAWIKTDEDANRYCLQHSAEQEMAKLRIAKRVQWKEKYYDFNELLELFTSDRKKQFPNSYSGTVNYLERYVFHYFLQMNDVGNVHKWPQLYKPFKKWLETATSSWNGKVLTYRTKNQVINALNNFLKWMMEEERSGQIQLCKVFPDHIANNRRGIESVIADNEYELVRARLKELDQDCYEFFELLMGTGLRLNEAFGLSLDDIAKGLPPSPSLQSDLNFWNIPCVGYIYLESQPAKAKGGFRDNDGSVPRKPLKWKRKIAPENSRTIPISDKGLFNILVGRYKKQKELYETKVYGTARKDYLLFDGLTKGKLSKTLEKAFLDCRLKYKSPHCCRHSYATKLAGRVRGHNAIVQTILGHKNPKETLQYVHLAEQMAKENIITEQMKDDLDFVS